MSMLQRVTMVLLIAAAVIAPAAAAKDRAPIVIGHRGASGYLPEHTLAAYALAIEQGADYVEPDLVSTKDGVLIARHENALAIVNPTTGAIVERTTDVNERPRFADRKTTKIIDGTPITGWFSEDFTLAEIKTLRAVERIPQLRPQNTAYDYRYEIPTLQEVIDLVKRRGGGRGGRIGLYPETKHPMYFDSIGLSMEEPLVATLHKNGYRGKNAPVYIQSFEVGNLRDLSTMTRLPLVQLLNASGRPYDFVASGDPRTYADLATPAGLREIASYADGIGANKNLIVPRDSQNRLLAPTTLINDAHAAGLIVHGWTFRRENTFLPQDFRRGDPASPTYPREYGDMAAEVALFFRLGIDGVFTDNPDVAAAVRDQPVR